MGTHMDGSDITILAPRLTAQWLAGFFDGEGCVNARVTNSGTTTSIRVSITQSDPYLLSLIMGKFPPSSFTPFVHQLKNGRGTSTTYNLTWNGTLAISILEYIKDHVILKYRQVRLGLEFCNLIGQRGFHSGNSVEDLSRREEIVKELKSLNDKGQYYVTQ